MPEKLGVFRILLAQVGGSSVKIDCLESSSMPPLRPARRTLPRLKRAPNNWQVSLPLADLTIGETQQPIVASQLSNWSRMR